VEHRAACSCGQLSLTFEGEVPRLSICHCLACQRRTGSVFGVQARVERARATIAGRATRYDRPTDEGDAVGFHFCPACGATVYWEIADFPDHWVVPIGALADPTFGPAPTFSVYEERMHPWVVLPPTVTERWA
jgi:hypothetical protein